MDLSHPLPWALVFIGGCAVYAWRQGQSDDLGSVVVTDRHKAESDARLHADRHSDYAPARIGGETTREREAREQCEIDAAIVAKREAIAEARRQAEAQAHRPVPFRQRRMG